MRVLVADDSVVSRHLLDATLRKWGYDVVVACDGSEAWEILQSDDSPTLAILDWMMPGITGPEVCRLVRQRAKEPYSYLMLLTSKSSKEELIEGMEAGADDYITKAFDQHELKVRLRAGTRIVELQAELMITRESMREQATKDSLTHLWNRSSVLDILQRELSRGEREGRPVGLVIVDLDDFKSINDTHGHFAGDAVLREAVRRMQSTVRPYDSIGRYGGEEFLVILPGCDEGCTANQAERMRAAVCRESIILADVRMNITASFGGTVARPSGLYVAETLIRTADEALYLAKHQGKNRVVFHDTDISVTETRKNEIPEALPAQGVLR